VDNIIVSGNGNILYLKNFTGDGGYVIFPVNTVLVVKETPWLE